MIAFLSLQLFPSPLPQVSFRNSKNRFHPFFPHLETKCSTMKELQQIHAQLIITGFINHTLALTKLVSLSCSLPDSTSLTYACLVFYQCHQPNIIIWNTIIRAFVIHNLPNRAILGYLTMLQESMIFPDKYTFPSLLKGCAQLLAFTEGKILHGQIMRFGFQSDIYIQTSLVKMYSACGDLYSARQVFDKMRKRTPIVWTSMISGYASNHYAKEALQLFSEMENEGQEPDEITIATALSACAELRDLGYGRKLHSHVEESGMRICVVLGTSLVDMYGKCGDLDSAREVFDKMPERNVVAWSAMISGYARNNRSREALKLFKEMVVVASERPNEITMIAVLSACGQSGDLNLGKWVHSYIDRKWPNPSVSLENSLVDMYAKCGQIDAACRVFYDMKEKDIYSWNTMITGLALHGYGEEALSQFSLMQMDGIRPDDITFIGVLSACSHAGLVEEGLFHYQNMKEKFRIVPKLEHFGCMVDLLGRAGHLEEAERFIREMPMEPNGAVWGAFLGACRVYNRVELGEKAAMHLLEIEPRNDAVYVLLSNIFALKKQWDDVKNVRKLMHERGVRKVPGCSSIEVDGVIHEFLVGDRSHPESEKIYLMLNHVLERLKDRGYVAETSEVLLNIDEEEKEDSISWHSEKLAICFGLIKTKPGAEILIMKNLRLCGDCHTAIKFVSEIFERRITVRDRSRFHHFKEGYCSCGDYW